jgi:CBS domain-containing protein
MLKASRKVRLQPHFLDLAQSDELIWRNVAASARGSTATYLPRREPMRAAQVMTPDILSISPDATIFEAAELLIGVGVSAMPVVDKAGKMVGIVSEADLIRRAELGTEPHKSWLQRLFSDDAAAAKEYVTLHARRVTDVMSRNVVTAQEDDSLGHVAELMAHHKVKRVPVLRGEELVGIVSRANLLQALLSWDPKASRTPLSDDQIRREIERAVSKQPWTSPWPTNIVVNSGVVHLWGFVPTQAASDAYRVAAENVPGVRKVKNHLRRIPSAVGMGV